jgi:cyclophilin family peptidyl-prolyl cis-trans isomerase
MVDKKIIIDLSKKCPTIIHTMIDNILLTLIVEKTPIIDNNLTFLAREEFHDSRTFYGKKTKFIAQGVYPTI